MSYASMDHAGWVERNSRAARSMYKPKRDKNGDIIGPHGAPDKLTQFQAKVMDILGMVFGGIYNAPITWDSVDWNYGGGISVIVSGNGFSTFDFSRLTNLVFLCHEARIRGEIDPANFSRLRLSFWQRKPSGGMGESHPNLDEAVSAFRAYLPADHRIIYREPELAVEIQPPEEARSA